MPSLSTRLTGDVLRQAVEDATTRDCTPDGLELTTRTTDWDYAADALGRTMQHVFYSQDICDHVCAAWVETGEDDGRTDWHDAAAALCDAIEARREPDAAPEGDR